MIVNIKLASWISSAFQNANAPTQSRISTSPNATAGIWRLWSTRSANRRTAEPCAAMVVFSVIMATRNRPSLFAEALRSVLHQTCEDIEIIVVNDGSNEEHLPEYRATHRSGGAARSIPFSGSAVKRPWAELCALTLAPPLALGKYLCFLDDDDFWTDADYLSRIQSAIAQRAAAPDLIFSSQAAFFGNQRKEGPIWLERLAAKLERAERRPGDDGLYSVTVEELVGAGGFCHLNTMIVRRALYDAVGGMDEDIRWECDHDLFLRLIDRAGDMLLSPAIVSRHNIPDPAKPASMTTSLNEVQRRLVQLRVFEKASLFAAHPAIRSHGRQYQGYTLKRIAEALAARRLAHCCILRAPGARRRADRELGSIYALYVGKNEVRLPRSDAALQDSKKTGEEKSTSPHARFRRSRLTTAAR